MKRREFVKLSGAAAASVIMIPPALQSCMDNMNMNMNMGSNAVTVKEGAFTTPLAFPNVMSSNFSIVHELIHTIPYAIKTAFIVVMAWLMY